MENGIEPCSIMLATDLEMVMSRTVYVPFDDERVFVWFANIGFIEFNVYT